MSPMDVDCRRERVVVIVVDIIIIIIIIIIIVSYTTILIVRVGGVPYVGSEGITQNGHGHGQGYQFPERGGRR